MKNFKEMVYGNLFEAKVKNPGKYKTGMKVGYDKDGDGVPNGADKDPLDGSVQEETGDTALNLLDEEAHEEAKPSLEEEVKTILDEEGGAADLKKIEEKLLAKNMDVSGLEEKLKDMKNVMKHEKGDYIEMSGLKEENPDMMLPAE